MPYRVVLFDHRHVLRGDFEEIDLPWGFGVVVVAALMLPLDGRSAMLRFSGDVVAFAYVLALGRFVLVLGALDTGSSFEGMGASREVTFAALVEFGFFIALASLSVATHELSLGTPTQDGCPARIDGVAVRADLELCTAAHALAGR